MTDLRSRSTISSKLVTIFALLFMAALFVFFGTTRVRADVSLTLDGVADASAAGDEGDATDGDVVWHYVIYHVNHKADEASTHGDCYIEISAVRYYGDALKVFTVPDFIKHDNGDTYRVTGISDGVFKNNLKIIGLKCGDNMQRYGNDCFYGCEYLTESVLKTSLTSIGARCFYGCKAITDVTIGPKVSHIGDGAFANCTSLVSIKVNSGNPSFRAEDEMLYSYNWDRLIACAASKTMAIIPSSVKTIGSQAFDGCERLTSVTIASGSALTTIGDKAFYNCYRLPQITLPGTVGYIGDDAFTGCASYCATPFVIYGSRSRTGVVEEYAKRYHINSVVYCTVRFYNGTVLVKEQTDVPVGGSATPPVLPERLGYTLTWNKSYTNITDNVDIYADWKANYTVTFKDSYSGAVTTTTGYYGQAVKAPEWVREGYVLSWDTQEYGCVVKNLTVNAVWTVSWTGAKIEDDKPFDGEIFSDNRLTYQITSLAYNTGTVAVVGAKSQSYLIITIPETTTYRGCEFKVTKINPQAFRGMKQLKKVNIGTNIKTISKWSFYGCSALKRINIYTRNLGTVGTYAFSKTNSKAVVDVPNNLVKKYKRKLLDAGLSKNATVK